MTTDQRARVMIALTDQVMLTISDFSLSSYHGVYETESEPQCYWDVIISPMSTRIYFLPEIVRTVEALQMDLAIYTDLDRPGCIIIH